MARRLTQKQKTFCLKYFELGNATEAALIAGYSSKNARFFASRLLTKANIQNCIQGLRQKAEDASVMNVLERKQKLSEIARARLTDFMELGQDGSWVNIGEETPQGGAIQEIRSRTEYDEDGSKPTVHTMVKLHDPIKAIDLLNKMDKIYTDGAQVNVNVNQMEAKIVHFDPKAIAAAILEAERLGLTPEILAGNGHGEDASLLSSPANIQTTPVPEPED